MKYIEISIDNKIRRYCITRAAADCITNFNLITTYNILTTSEKDYILSHFKKHTRDQSGIMLTMERARGLIYKYIYDKDINGVLLGVS